MLVREAERFGLRALNSVWFSYADLSGRHFVEVDHLLIGDGKIWVLESKLTQTSRGILQVETLYKPIVEKCYPGFQVLTVMVCQNLIRETSRLATSLEEVLLWDKTTTLTWHWLGR